MWLILQHPVTNEIKETKKTDHLFVVKAVINIIEEKISGVEVWPNVDAGTDLISWNEFLKTGIL